MNPVFMVKTEKIIAEIRPRTCIDKLDIEVIKEILQDELKEYCDSLREYYAGGYDDGYDAGYDACYDTYKSSLERDVEGAYDDGYALGYSEGRAEAESDN